jgi:zinc-binding in reverse transcriptase
MFRGLTNYSADIWWHLPIPLKIIFFMWLVVQIKILTKDNLLKRGWSDLDLCTMCSSQESMAHLFVTCRIAQQVWFWLGYCQSYFTHWHSFRDVLDFTHSLSLHLRNSFLIVLSAVCWFLCKCHNEIIFRNSNAPTIRSLKCLISSLVNYWPGGFGVALLHKIKTWLPESLDLIPL